MTKELDLHKIGLINKKINSPMHLNELLTVIMDVAKELVGAEGSSLLLADQETDDLIFNIVTGEKGNVIRGDRLPSGAGIAGHVALTGEPLIVNDAQKDERFYRGVDSKYDFHTRNIVCVPMKVVDTLVGVLEVVNSTGRDSFDECDLDLARYIADTAAIAISNRRLYFELTSRIEELTALYEFSQSISCYSGENDFFLRTIETLVQLIRVEKGSIILYDEERGSLVLKAASGLPDDVYADSVVDLTNSVAGFVFRNGDPLLVSDISREFGFITGSRNRSYKTQSFISIPIKRQGATIGVLSLADKLNRAQFDAFDLRVLSTVASQIAEVHQNIQYQKNMLEQQRLAREIDVASEIQANILPRIPESIGAHHLAAMNRPAKEVGGDFYDFFKFDENKYGIVVADVSGKGIPAAIFMGTARNVIRAESRISNQPGTLLRKSNRYIYEDSEQGMFVTLIYVLIDTHNNIITYANGGHNDQILYKKKTGEVIKLNADGIPLGISDRARFEERIIFYEPGDMLVLFTDGILEYLGDLDIDRGEMVLTDAIRTFIDEGPAALVNHFSVKMATEDINTDAIDDFTLFAVQF